MQVNALSSLLQTLLANPVKRPTPAAFAPEPQVLPAPTASTVATPAQSVQMLVALAAATMPPHLERRRRIAKNAEKGLTALETLQAALIVGVGSAEPARELRAWIEERTPSDDPELERLMDEIDLRAQVELAKYERE